MYKDKYVFAQLVSFLDRNHFNYLVRKYGGDKYVKFFSCWNQLLTLIFGQLSNRESLRDLIVAINAHQKKSYHLGFGKHVTKSNLAKANQNRDYRIFKDFAYFLVDEARRKCAVDIFKLDGNVYAFDSTMIDLFGVIYTYRCILTNNWMSTEKDIITFYNERGASEKNFDIQNNDFGWSHQPFSFMAENMVFMMVTAMLKNFYLYLIRHISEKVKPLKKTSRLKAFILYFVSVPAK